MLFTKYIVTFFWSFVKQAVENQLEMQNAELDTQRHIIVNIYGDDLYNHSLIYLGRNEMQSSETKPIEKENPEKISLNYTIDIPDVSLVSKKIIIPECQNIPITVEYYLSSSKNTGNLAQSSNKVAFLTKVCSDILNNQFKVTSFDEIACFLYFSYRIKNICFDNIFINSCRITYRLELIERIIKRDFKDKDLLYCNWLKFQENMNLLEIAPNNCPILSFLPALIYIKDFILEKLNEKNLIEKKIFSIYYGCKIIESILYYNKLDLTLTDASIVVGENFKSPDYKLTTDSIQFANNNLSKIIDVIELIRKLLAFEKKDYRIILLIRRICIFFKRDFFNNKYSKNTISRCVLDLVFLFDDETIKYITEYYYILDRVTYKYRVICQGSSDDKKYFSFNESLKFIQYYLKLFKSETFKKYIRMSEAEYNQYMIKFEEIKNDIYNDLKDISIREKIFIALEKYHIFIRYNMNLRFNSLIFTEEYKTKMNKYYKDLKMT